MKDFAGIELQAGAAIVIDWEDGSHVFRFAFHAAIKVLDTVRRWRNAIDRITGELTRYWPLPVEHDPETGNPNRSPKPASSNSFFDKEP